MIPLSQWLEQTTAKFSQAGIASARLDAELLLADALNVERTWLIAHPQELIQPHTANANVKRRLAREPLAYIRGWQEFYGHRFKVSPDVLIPRPESESLVTFLRHLSPAPSSHIVDIGTGSGCLGISSLLALPHVSVTLADMSLPALEIARENIATLIPPTLQERITTVHSDLLRNITTKTDIILANLPYVDKSWDRSVETAYEPELALFARQQGLELIFTLITQAAHRLVPGNYLLLEADTRQLPDIKRFATQHQFVAIQEGAFCVVLQKPIRPSRT